MSNQIKKKGIVILGILSVVGIATFLFYNFYLKPAKIPSWQGLKPGITSKQDVIKKLGEPIEKREIPYGSAYIYPSDFEVFPNVVIFDKEEKAKTFLVSVPLDEPIKFSDLVEKYGQPEKEMYNSIAWNTKTYIFAKRGLVVVANKEVDQVFQIQYLEPTTVEKYLEEWGPNLSEENPYIL